MVNIIIIIIIIIIITIKETKQSLHSAWFGLWKSYRLTRIEASDKVLFLTKHMILLKIQDIMDIKEVLLQLL